MPLYNFAMTPINPTISECISNCAQKYFADNNKEYLTGKNSIPHLTLNHFTAESDEDALKTYKAFTGKVPLKLEFTEFYFKVSENKNMWSEFLIKKTPEIMTLQEDVYAYLNEHGHNPRKQPEAYTPHITLAGMTEKPSLTPTLADLPEPYIYKFRTSLGASSELGAFEKDLTA